MPNAVTLPGAVAGKGRQTGATLRVDLTRQPRAACYEIGVGSFAAIVIAVNVFFAVVVIALIAVGINAARRARRAPSRGTVRAAWVCGVILLAGAVLAAAMAVNLNDEGEPGWLVAVWFGTAVVFAGVSVSNFAATRRRLPTPPARP